MWGPLTDGSHRSATAGDRIGHLIPVFEFFCDFYIFSLVASKIGKSIWLCSLGRVVFRKNIFLTFTVENLGDLNRDLKCVFECMQICLFYI